LRGIGRAKGALEAKAGKEYDGGQDKGQRKRGKIELIKIDKDFKKSDSNKRDREARGTG